MFVLDVAVIVETTVSLNPYQLQTNDEIGYFYYTSRVQICMVYYGFGGISKNAAKSRESAYGGIVYRDCGIFDATATTKGELQTCNGMT